MKKHFSLCLGSEILFVNVLIPQPAVTHHMGWLLSSLVGSQETKWLCLICMRGSF